mgnify:CR=1 FL=1
MAEKQSKNKWHTPAERIMMLGFAAVILLGTILLCLPVSAADGKSVYWLDALFTATTSVCVTGLVTVPTATTWSTFGKIVILGLIQFGGLGIMACLTMVFLILRRKISLQSRKLIQDTYNLPVLKGSVGIVRRLLIGTATVEIAGRFCIASGLCRSMASGRESATVFFTPFPLSVMRESISLAKPLLLRL